MKTAHFHGVAGENLIPGNDNTNNLAVNERAKLISYYITEGILVGYPAKSVGSLSLGNVQGHIFKRCLVWRIVL